MAKKLNRCSFCGRSEKDVPLMLNGLEGFICSDCVEMAHQMVRENLKSGRGKKIYVLKYKAKKNEKKKIGHRQDYTKVRITKIVG